MMSIFLSSAVIEGKKEAKTEGQDKAKENETGEENEGRKKENKNVKEIKKTKDDVQVTGEEKAKPKRVIKQHSPGQKYKKEWNTHDGSL